MSTVTFRRKKSQIKLTLPHLQKHNVYLKRDIHKNALALNMCVCKSDGGEWERRERERASLGSTKRPESLWVCCGIRYLHNQRYCGSKGLTRGVVEHQRKVHSQDFWGTDVGGQVETCKGIWEGWSLQLMEWDRGWGEESCWSLLFLHKASWKEELDVQHRVPGPLELGTPLCLSLLISYCSGLRRGMIAFHSAFQIMHRLLLWKIVTWKHTEKESLGNIVTAKTSWHSKIHSVSYSVKGGKHKTVESCKGNFGSIRADWVGKNWGFWRSPVMNPQMLLARILWRTSLKTWHWK